jgi:NaMN:DMB phosphoribosyltransferase
MTPNPNYPPCPRGVPVQGVTVLADRTSGELTVILLCASADLCGQLPAIHLKGLASGEPRQEDVAVALHEQYTTA